MAAKAAKGAKSGAKSGTKAAAKGRRPGTFKPGYDPRRGRGPKPGAPNAGRPPNEYKKLMAELLNSPEAIDALRTVLRDPENRGYAAVRRLVEERAYGKVPQAIDASVTGKLLLVRDVSEVEPVDGEG